MKNSWSGGVDECGFGIADFPILDFGILILDLQVLTAECWLLTPESCVASYGSFRGEGSGSSENHEV